MQKKNIIIIILALCLVINILHDLLPYHNHGITHCHKEKTSQKISETEDNQHHCDGHDMCVVCLLKVKTQFHFKHQEVDFHAAQTRSVVKPETVKAPKHPSARVVRTEDIHLLKSKFIKSPHSLRGPPINV